MVKFPQNTFGLSSLYIHVDMEAYADFSVYLAEEFGSIKNSYRPFTGEVITSMIERKTIHDSVEKKYRLGAVIDIFGLAMSRYKGNSRMIHAIAFAVADQYSEAPDEFRNSEKMKEFLTMLTDNYWDHYTVTALCRVARANKNISRVYQEVMQNNCSNYSGIFLLLTEFSDDAAFCSACSVFYQHIVDCLYHADREYTINNYAMLGWFAKRCSFVDFTNENICISEQAKKLITDVAMLISDACTGSKEKRLEKYGFSKYAVTYLNYKLHNRLDQKKEETIFFEYFKECLMYSTSTEQLEELLTEMKNKVIIFGKLNGVTLDYFKNYPAVYNTFKTEYSSFSLATHRFLCFSMTDERKAWIKVLSDDDYLVNLNWNIENNVPNVDTTAVPELLESGYMSFDAFSKLVAQGVIDLFSCDLENENVRNLLSEFISEFSSKTAYDLLFGIYEKYGIHFISESMPECMEKCLYCVSSYNKNVKVKIPLTADVDASYDCRLLDIILEFTAVRYMSNFNDVISQLLTEASAADPERAENLQKYLKDAIKASYASNNFKECLLGSKEEDDYDEEEDYDNEEDYDDE